MRSGRQWESSQDAAAIGNPYQSPQAAPVDDPATAAPAWPDWKRILRRWELLRLVYNGIVGTAGLLVLTSIPLHSLPEAAVGAILYGLLANVLYLLGPIVEIYLNWFADAGEGSLVPRWAVRCVRSHLPTALLFLSGTLFSVVLTLAIGFSVAMGAALQD